MALLDQLIAEEKQRDDLDHMVDEIVLSAGGDIRKAIRGLVLGQFAVEAELRDRISLGYVRGRR